MNTLIEEQQLTKKDFASDIDVKWCPGCGDYAILSSMQTILPQIGVPKEKIVFVSGIGCSSRFPHYMSTYGFHTIHGRAPAVATGLKIVNPDLSVWVITGDGDGLSIGGNHLIHSLRRNIGLKILLFNNNIYGLTKGQASPTSKPGTTTKSTPYGSLDSALKPVSFALSMGATFIARSSATDPKHLQEVLLKASKHEGTAFVEILQNCVIFNDKVHEPVTGIATKDETQIKLEEGRPIIFGKEKNKGIRFNTQSGEYELVIIGENGITESDLLIHKENSTNKPLQIFLGELEIPAVLGVIKSVSLPTYEDQINGQVKMVQDKKGKGDINKLLFNKDECWEIT